MSGSGPPLGWSGRAYLLFLAAVVAVLVLLAGLGAMVASARADGSLPAILAALAVAGLASAASGVVISVTGGQPSALFTRTVLATLVRLVLAAGLGVVCVLVLGVERGPFLIWLAIAYLALLSIDTVFSVRAARAPSDSL